MPERGAIRNRQRAKQLRDFTGLRWGKITPTDVDGGVEFGDKLFVFMEAKSNGAAMPFGQCLFLQRTCDAIAETGREAIVLILEHGAGPEDDVDYASCLVTEYRYNGVWQKPAQSTTCKVVIDAIRKRAGI